MPFPENFLETLYSIPGSEKSNDFNFDSLEKPTDYIFDKIDEAFLNGEFDLVDLILPQINLNELNPSLLISFLCITKAAKSKLNNREAFYLKVEATLLKERGEEKTKRLLWNLR